MDDMQMLDAVERYIRGEMNPDERMYFEQLRKTNPEVDQMVVEHTLFMQQMNRFGEWRKFKSTLNNLHTDLAEKGTINSAKLKGKAKVVYLWNRYKRVTAIAASIACVTALTISMLIWSIGPKADSLRFQNLSRDLEQVKREQKEQKNEVNNLKNQMDTVSKITGVDPNIHFKSGGSGFLIDAKGYLITNAHVVRTARNIAVQNSKGQDFNARLVHLDLAKDLAILKIEDDNFKPLASLPYVISKSSTDLAEPIYTLGYPKNEIVYGQGYLSAKTGFNGDTLTCQIEIAANPGNSGSPILNRNGEVIGVLNARQTDTEGFTFAIHSKYIYQAIDALKKDSIYNKVKLPTSSQMKTMDRVQQVKKIEGCVYMVKVN